MTFVNSVTQMGFFCQGMLCSTYYTTYILICHAFHICAAVSLFLIALKRLDLRTIHGDPLNDMHVQYQSISAKEMWVQSQRNTVCMNMYIIYNYYTYLRI